MVVSSPNRTTGEAPPIRLKPSVLKQLRERLFTTPGRLAGFTVAVVVVCAIASVLVTVVFSGRNSAVSRIRENAAPVVIASQRLSSSLAEADAAATAAFLSGVPEDRSQRQVYEESLASAARSVEQVARLIGNDPLAHASLASINAKVLRYAGLVEVARTQGQAGDTGASVSLDLASTYLRVDITPDLLDLSRDAKLRLENDVTGARRGALETVVVLALALVLLLALQVYLIRATNRIVNPGLLLGSLALLALIIWTSVATQRQETDLTAALSKSGASIESLSKLRAAAYSYEGSINRSLIAGQVPQPTDRAVVADRTIDPTDTDAALENDKPLGGLLGEVRRITTDRALGRESLVRWQRFLDVSDRLAAAPDAASRAAIVSGDGSATFSAFNATVDAMLTTDESAFLSDLDGVRYRLRLLPPALLAVPLLAALLGLLGLQRRIGEYR